MLKQLARAIDRDPPEDEIQALLEEHPMWAKQQAAIGMAIAAMILAAVGLLAFFMVTRNPPPPVLYMVNQKDDATRSITQKTPTLSPAALREWAKEVVQKTYTFNFLNVDDQVLSARPYFTSDGWAVFSAAWESSGIYKKVQKERLSVSITPTMEPIQKDSIETKNFSAWMYEVPALISYSGDVPTTPQNVVITLTFVQVPTTENPRGLGVTQMITTVGAATP